ncbi:ATP-binding protein [Silvibacterium acidisoli]|uniref:ATP-binding protein n=1 Tax=Acidobacteriaceae bacterium ZG23-2 TaxID=2883246 RepID=UPI00406C6B71
MSSPPPDPVTRSAAWRISLWATLAFAVGTLIVFAMLQQFMVSQIQQRSDAWLSGEVAVLGDVAGRTPKDNLYDRVVGEVAELASREVPNQRKGQGVDNSAVFFLQAAEDGPPRLWVGEGDGLKHLEAIRSSRVLAGVPRDVKVRGTSYPFRVAATRIADGSYIYLGLSEQDELRVLRDMMIRFVFIWLLIVLLGFVIVFYTTRRMLGYVREITEAASHIGESDLTSRVPNLTGKDEVGHLARTLNRMLDRIENTVHQLHTITGALAHDLRSPLTAVRGKLEVSLSRDLKADQIEPIAAAIDELDRLTDFLNASLDVAEAKADALRLSRREILLDELVRDMIALYEPSMAEKGIQVSVKILDSCQVLVDAALIHRVLANLLDNEIKHLPPCCNVQISLHADEKVAVLTVEDNGPGFDIAVQSRLFQQRVKGRDSRGYGLGLAFVQAVVRAHGGAVSASNRLSGGIRLSIEIPLTKRSGGSVHDVIAARA